MEIKISDIFQKNFCLKIKLVMIMNMMSNLTQTVNKMKN